MFPSTKATPYVYCCTHKITGKFYIGYREKNVKLCKPSNIDLPIYKTSSKIVNPDFNNYDWKIIAEFNNGEDAYDFEQQLIFENWSNPLILNKYHTVNKNGRFKAVKGTNKGKKQTADHIKKRASKLKGMHQSDETKAKKSLAQLGKPSGMLNKLHSEDTRNKMRNSHLGILKSSDFKIKQSAARLGIKRGPYKKNK